MMKDNINCKYPAIINYCEYKVPSLENLMMQLELGVDVFCISIVEQN